MGPGIATINRAHQKDLCGHENARSSEESVRRQPADHEGKKALKRPRKESGCCDLERRLRVILSGAQEEVSQEQAIHENGIEFV